MLIGCPQRELVLLDFQNGSVMQRKMCNSAVEEIGALFFLEVFPYILKKKEICAESGLKNDLENEDWMN